jgi:drug/metabolite transporter (DMT)-like permease
VAAVLLVRRQFCWPGRDLLIPIGIVATLDTLIPYTLVGWAESRIESGTAAVLKEKVGPARLAGIGIGFLGVLTMIGGPSALMESGAAGQIAVIGAAASYAVGALYARTLLSRVDAANFTVTKLTIGAGLASIATLAMGEGGGFPAMEPSDVAALATLGMVSTGIAFVLYFRIVQGIGSVGASTVTYIIPMFALLFGTMFLDETIETETVAGMALIVSGVAAVMYAPWVEAAVRRAIHRPRAVAPA